MSSQSMQPDINDNDVAPWYRQGWFWFVFGIPMASICLGTTMVIVAFTHQPSMVKDDYYREGKAINQVIARNQFAEERRLSAEINLDALTGEVLVSLDSTIEQYPQTLRLSFLSPTLPEQDQVLIVKQVSPDRFIGQLDKQISGRRYIHLETIELQDKDAYKPSEKGWMLEIQHNIEAGKSFSMGYSAP